MRHTCLGLAEVDGCRGAVRIGAAVLRETREQFAQHNAKNLGLIPGLVSTPACEQPFSHLLLNHIFSIQLCNELGRDESEGKSGSRGRERGTPQGIRRAEAKSLCGPI